jgi:hypothetical protein
MAFDRENPVVGDIVYRSYRAGRVGKIQRVVSKKKDSIWGLVVEVEVEWDSKKAPRKEVVYTIGLNSVHDLVATHKKKLKTLQARIKKAQKL